MSTFKGKIDEIPGISVDCFLPNNYDSKAFFLSHFHSDHIRGLYEDGADFIIKRNLPLYTSALTKEIIKRKNPVLAEQVKEMDIKHPNSVTVGGIILSVTLIPAGHCPGSVMFLFETKASRILYTGDYRIGVSDVRKFRSFYDSLGNVKKIDKIYLDTTFFLDSYPMFPTRSESMSVISKLITEWTSRDENNVIVLQLSANYGYECLFKDIYAMCKMKIYIDEQNLELYSLIPQLDGCFAIDRHDARIFCKNVPFPIAQRHIRFIKPSAFRWTNSEKKATSLKNDNEGETYYVCYSTHASYEEGLAFINCLKPQQIHVCVERENPVENLHIKQLIHQALSAATRTNEAKRIKLFNVKSQNSIYPISKS
ncbi:hypothetical protein GWI33_012485 [Rhynchophorus ferrugineus]|uniref:Protein artemis n=1 Tax=Rhynchophorus ferrugineus TaxID=354439 RepID=A0A834IBI4_RHYFE|nr:hypothetical protein GWI33_012485 [Rhynchophorus ferrugineus]